MLRLHLGVVFRRDGSSDEAGEEFEPSHSVRDDMIDDEDNHSFIRWTAAVSYSDDPEHVSRLDVQALTSVLGLCLEDLLKSVSQVTNILIWSLTIVNVVVCPEILI